MANPSKNITLSDDNLLAEYISLDKFKGVLEQRVAVGPDLLAMLIKDGQIAQAEPGGHFAIGGIWRTLKDAIAGQHSIRLLIADLKPFQLTTSADSLSKDNVPIAGEFTLELQVNPEKPANVLGFMKEHGAVTKSSVLSRLAPHLGDRVLNAAVRQMNALELRGNKGMQDKIQADAMKEVERLLADVGIMVRGVSMRWAFNEEEKAEITKRQKAREQEALEQDFQILSRAMTREAESSIVKLKADASIETAKITTEDDLKRLILGNELNFIDAREEGVRVQQMKALRHELELNATQRRDNLNQQLEAEDQILAIARKKEEQRKQGRGQELDETRHGDEQRRLARERELTDLEHGKKTRDLGGQQIDINMSIVERQRQHDVRVEEIRAGLRVVQRSIEEADTKSRLMLAELEQVQNMRLAEIARENNLRAMRGMQDVEIDAEARRLDLNIKGGDATHRRAMEDKKLEKETELEKIRILASGTPEQILAINAGFSPQVANVLIEQAKARATEGTDRMALMREMVQQAKDANVASADQARTFFTTGMTGVQGVAQGVGTAVGAGAGIARGGGAAAPNRPAGNEEPQTAECPGCHRTIPVTDRHCRYCGRQMRQ